MTALYAHIEQTYLEGMMASSSTNVSLAGDLIDQAREMGINISKAFEARLRNHVDKLGVNKWIEKNRPAMEAWNCWIEENGMPLPEYREL